MAEELEDWEKIPERKNIYANQSDKRAELMHKTLATPQPWDALGQNPITPPQATPISRRTMKSRLPVAPHGSDRYINKINKGLEAPRLNHKFEHYFPYNQYSSLVNNDTNNILDNEFQRYPEYHSNYKPRFAHQRNKLREKNFDTLSRNYNETTAHDLMGSDKGRLQNTLKSLYSSRDRYNDRSAQVKDLLAAHGKQEQSIKNIHATSQFNDRRKQQLEGPKLRERLQSAFNDANRLRNQALHAPTTFAGELLNKRSTDVMDKAQNVYELGLEGLNDQFPVSLVNPINRDLQTSWNKAEQLKAAPHPDKVIDQVRTLEKLTDLSPSAKKILEGLTNDPDLQDTFSNLKDEYNINLRRGLDELRAKHRTTLGSSLHLSEALKHQEALEKALLEQKSNSLSNYISQRSKNTINENQRTLEKLLNSEVSINDDFKKDISAVENLNKAGIRSWQNLQSELDSQYNDFHRQKNAEWEAVDNTALNRKMDPKDTDYQTGGLWKNGRYYLGDIGLETGENLGDTETPPGIIEQAAQDLNIPPEVDGVPSPRNIPRRDVEEEEQTRYDAHLNNAYDLIDQLRDEYYAPDPNARVIPDNQPRIENNAINPANAPYSDSDSDSDSDYDGDVPRINLPPENRRGLFGNFLRTDRDRDVAQTDRNALTTRRTARDSALLTHRQMTERNAANRQRLIAQRKLTENPQYVKQQRLIKKEQKLKEYEKDVLANPLTSSKKAFQYSIDNIQNKQDLTPELSVRKQIVQQLLPIQKNELDRYNVDHPNKKPLSRLPANKMINPVLRAWENQTNNSVWGESKGIWGSELGEIFKSTSQKDNYNYKEYLYWIRPIMEKAMKRDFEEHPNIIGFAVGGAVSDPLAIGYDKEGRIVSRTRVTDRNGQRYTRGFVNAKSPYISQDYYPGHVEDVDVYNKYWAAGYI